MGHGVTLQVGKHMNLDKRIKERISELNTLLTKAEKLKQEAHTAYQEAQRIDGAITELKALKKEYDGPK